MSRNRRAKSRREMSQAISYSNRVPSRKIRREKKKVLSQSFMMIGIAVILLFAFIFVIIPNFFNFVTNFLNTATPFQEVDDIPPQIPIVSAPVNATNSAQLSISGFGEPDAEVIFTLNGTKEDAVVIQADGSFKVELQLEEGENRIAAYSIDKAKNESSVTREYSTLLDTTAPKIELTEPADGTKFETRANQSITLTGMTDEDTSTRVYVNDKLVFPKADGSFSYTYRLEEGENKLTIGAQDKAGNSNQIEVTYNFSL